ncbi:aspartate aminotransferase family protein [Pseudalkalibacillus hwajinpoensis]|uniref:pyridoxal phosphate-dependent decarboxylase family protein n=1 Tax=Guptibacillus hwajinpoensis TaxID=208199 RepID=UPI00325AD4B4
MNSFLEVIDHIQLTEKDSFDSLFLHSGEKGQAAFQEQIEQVTRKIVQTFNHNDGPFVGKKPEEIQSEIEGLMEFPDDSRSFNDVIEEIGTPLLKNNLQVSHEKSIAHLHCPPLVPAIAAELVISAFNQSLDSWDQSTSATYIEQRMVDWLTGQFGYSETSDGTFTSGGTQSNYMGLLLARDEYCFKKWGRNIKKDGLPADFHRLRILCSEEAHFTVQKSAAQLGLGERAVISVKTDDDHRISTHHLKQVLTYCKQDGNLPFALVGTCGTTDFGSVDPIVELAQIAAQEDLWFHIDAAFGGALILSNRFKWKLDGINLANSIAVDFHKLFYQPISCGAFLVKDKQSFQFLNHHADYLNPAEDDEEGIPNLVNKSILTSKRFDAFKLFLSLKTVGVKKFATMIDYTFALAQDTVNYLALQNDMTVLNHHPELNTVIFRYEPNDLCPNLCQLNRKIQQQMLYEGSGAIAKTTVNGDTYLKFTMLNPRTKLEHVEEIVCEIRALGKKWRKDL